MVLNIINKYLNNYPFLSRSIIGGWIVGSGDVLAQFLIEKRSLFSENNSFDFIRYSRALFMGSVIITPWLTIWYGKMIPYLINFPVFKNFSANQKVILSTVIDQTINASICTTLYLTIITFLQTKDIFKGFEVTKNNFVDVMIVNYYIWPIAMIFNFKFIPIEYRTIYSNSVAVFWNLYLSLKNEKIKKTKVNK